MKQIWIPMLVAAALAGSGCAAGMSVSSDFDPQVDFSSFRTYVWGPADGLPTGDPRLDNNPFFDTRVRAAVDRQLETKGLRRVSSASADLLIHYHATVQERVDFYTVDREQGYEAGYDTQVIEYEEGTLMLDMAVQATKQVVWRGWARTNITGVIDDREKMQARIEEAARRMLAQFPPTSP